LRAAAVLLLAGEGGNDLLGNKKQVRHQHC
jgi:hypothetical protein